MRLVYFGSGAFGLPTLSALSKTHTLAAIITQPDKPSGRGGEITPTPIGAHAAQHFGAVPLLKPASVNDPEVVSSIRDLDVDAWVVIAYGQKLGKKLLDGVFAINLHASLLPRWRGASPISAAILAGDSETGLSVITLADRMDAGLVLGRDSHPIDPNLTAGELAETLSSRGPGLMQSVLAGKVAGSLRSEAQDESQVTIAPKLAKFDGWVDFAETAEACRRRIHGLTPWPGVTVRFRGQPLKLLRVHVDPSRSSAPAGAIENAVQGTVACSGSRLQLLEVHPAGRRPMPWSEFARGQRVCAGEQLAGDKPQ